MATISENLQALNEAKAAIKTAIENKGVDMTDVPFTQYAEKIESIQGGGVNTLQLLLNANGGIDYWFTKLKDEGVDEVEAAFSAVDTSMTASATYMLNQNRNITRAPLIDTRNVANFQYFANNASALKTVPAYDLRSATQASRLTNMFNGCAALEEVWVKNIKANLQVGSGTSYGHLLTLESLIHLIKELRDTGSARTLTVSTVSLEKLANVYVRTIDITDEMRAEDDLIDEKLPFEVCESTDEGAMLITDYVGLKNWSIVGA